MKKVLVLGCTGSIGTNTLDLIRSLPDSYSVCGLSANSSKDKLSSLCTEFHCKGVLASESGTAGLKELIASCGADIAVNGIAGAAGLEPSILVLEQGIDLALANKETVVMAWNLVKKTAEDHNCRILPVDSEHSAIFNLTQKIGIENISEIIITASGGPFREFTSEQLTKVTPEQALKHPTWNMGRKITIDSASLANKGLEVIEACRLFSMNTERIKVIVHPQSLVHSLVRTHDGMLYAQISNPDMKHPILSALAWPVFQENPLVPFDLAGCDMTFSAPRIKDFPMLAYAYDAAAKGASYTIAFNAANEIAAWAFINRQISFTAIPLVTESVLQHDWTHTPDCYEDVFDADNKARVFSQAFIDKHYGTSK